MKLNRPTIGEIKKYAAAFDKNGAGASYRAIKKLIHCFPKNNELEIILLKATTINALYNTNIKSVLPVAKKIQQLKIDEKIHGGSPSEKIVHEIALVKNKGKKRNNYSFATKYCHFHNESFYPIYDSYVKKLLKAYNKADGFYTGKPDFRNFSEFRAVLGKFRKHYKISEQKISWPTLDKFLWRYGKEMFPKNFN
jgi:hypothetical protein